MKLQWIRGAAIGAGALVLLAGVAVATGLWLAEQRMARRVDVPATAVALRDDPATVERGAYLFKSRGCVDCHGADGRGRTFVDDGRGLRLAGPKIAPGTDSATAAYTAADWDRAIRHGVAPGGRPLRIMPSQDYQGLTDADLAAIVAYVRRLPDRPGQRAVVELPLPARVLYGLGVIRDAAATIDHTRPPAQPVPEAVSVAHGRYVAQMCIGCHGPTFEGGRIPGAPPDWPAAPSLAPGRDSVMPRYASAEQLLHLFRTGTRGDGSAVRVMPFESLRELNDTDVRALHLYLQSLEASGSQ